MGGGLLIVLDVGKTLSKLTLWTRRGELVDRQTRRNKRCYEDGRVVLDAAGIEAWVGDVLKDFAALGHVDAIIPVGHGAAAAIIRDDRLASPPSDYESPVATRVRETYDSQRDPLAHTGSPALPDGLNLGTQLHRLEQQRPELLDERAQIVTWAQYWAWVLSGVASTEITSLGCHTDLWDPTERHPSDMARRRGWDKRLAPLRRASDALGTLRKEWVAKTGLPADVRVHCGLHDSNAALLAARGFREIAEHEATVLSTGTWFVAMRSPAPGTTPDVAAIPAGRDVLVNVDANGRAIPSARFMGGREIQLLTGVDSRRIDIRPDQPALLAAAPGVIASNAMVLPTMVPGCGPFPAGQGRWIRKPADSMAQRAVVSLYAALMADVSLDLIGSAERVLVEGRFAEAQLFVRALAALRPDTRFYTSNEHNDVSYGALRLLHPTLAPPGELKPVTPIEQDLSSYCSRWRAEAETTELDA